MSICKHLKPWSYDYLNENSNDTVHFVIIIHKSDQKILKFVRIHSCNNATDSNVVRTHTSALALAARALSLAEATVAAMDRTIPARRRTTG